MVVASLQFTFTVALKKFAGDHHWTSWNLSCFWGDGIGSIISCVNGLCRVDPVMGKWSSYDRPTCSKQVVMHYLRGNTNVVKHKIPHSIDFNHIRDRHMYHKGIHEVKTNGGYKLKYRSMKKLKSITFSSSHFSSSCFSKWVTSWCWQEL